MDARTRSEGTTNVEARQALAAWLRAGRDRRNLTIEDVAKVTKIQPRILQKLEAGSFEGLPAEVFVKGFVRSFAKCVGLDESEAIHRYTAAQAAGALTVAKALVDTMAPSSVRRIETRVEASSPAIQVPAIDPASEPAPEVASAPAVDALVEPAPAAAAAEPAAPAVETASPAQPVESVASAETATNRANQGAKKKKRSRKNAKQRKRKQQELAAATVASERAHASHTANESNDTAVEASGAESAPVAKLDGASTEAAIEAKTTEPLDSARTDGTVEEMSLAEGSQRFSRAVATPEDSETAAPDATASEPADDTTDTTASAGTWRPTMPPIASTPSVLWRRPRLPTTTASTYVVPTLVIDDADPDSADREREARNAKEPQRLSFLPPILLDREDRSARQGGLTLAVIILLIAATLTLSYLMRRPSPSGDGVTMLDESSILVG